MLQLHLAGRAAILLPTLAAAALAACSGNPKPKLLGDEYAAFGPRLAVVDSQRPPRDLSITLTQPAYAAVLFVVPGRGAVVVYPGDSATSNLLSAGTHEVRATWPRTFISDSLPAVATRLPDPRGRDSMLTAGRTTRPGTARGERPLQRGAITGGYLLLVATPAPLGYSALRSRVEGITIPIDDTEALNAVAKAARSAASPGATWAGYAVEVQVR